MLLFGGPVASRMTFEAANGGTDVVIHPEFKTPVPGLNHLARRVMFWSWRRGLRAWVTEIERSAKGVKSKA